MIYNYTAVATITFTSTFSSELMEGLTQYAKEQNTTKRAVLEEALKYFLRTKKQEKMEAGFKRMAKDPEMLELAEVGVEEWESMIRNWEQS